MFSVLICTVIATIKLVSGYVVVLSGHGDIIQGQTAQFRAEVFDNSKLSTEEFRFTWTDNAIPEHTGKFETKSPSIWNVTYDTRFPPGYYYVTVKVEKFQYFLWISVGTASKTFDVTSFLEGEVKLLQGNYTRKRYVSNSVPVTHEVVLDKPYKDFLNKTKNFLRTFWFVDCIYYGQVNGFKFDFNYTKPETIHHIEALLVATYISNLSVDNHLLTTTTTQKSTLSNSTLKPNVTTTTLAPHKNSSITNSTLDFDGIDEALKKWIIQFNKLHNATLSKQPDYCINSSSIPIASNYTYGFFKTNLTTKSPVKVSPINGTNWLMDGEILNITVSCNGSSPYSFCVLLESGLYNITGNETCKQEKMLRNCSFGIQHLFKKPSEYTLVVIISNAVSRVVKPIAVNIYKVKKHAQLSVIIVPVSFSLIATILIIFGVAYYVQSKRKYTVEVADFDFGNQSNMEYKTFWERLRESVSNSFVKSHDYDDNDSAWSDTVSGSARKYGSMQ